MGVRLTIYTACRYLHSTSAENRQAHMQHVTQYSRVVGRTIAPPEKSMAPTFDSVRADIYGTLNTLSNDEDKMMFLFNTLSCAIFAVGEFWGFDLAVKEAIRLRIELEAMQDAMIDPLKQ